jgi:hypothetical protein
MVMNAPTRFGWYRSPRWETKREPAAWEMLKQKAEAIVEAEPVIVEDYEERGVTSLRNERFQLSWYSGKRIPAYLDPSDYQKHSLNDWIEHVSMLRRIDFLGGAIDKNLAKYGLETAPSFIGSIDEQYMRLKRKPTSVVQRFLTLNERAKEGLYERIFGGSKKEINTRACKRVLIERKIH